MAKPFPKDKLITLLKETGDVFRVCSKKVKILSTLAWEPRVLEEFFAHQGTELPKPRYQIDVKMLDEMAESLKSIEPLVRGAHPLLHWLARTRESFVQAIELLKSLETPRFHEVSTQMYGNSQTFFYRGKTSNLELANLISGRLAVSALEDIQAMDPVLSAEQFAKRIERRLRNREPEIQVKVEVTDQIVAKVAAGAGRVRIRQDSTFSPMDVISLWNHEIESHCLTAHNGASHPHCNFLGSAGPRTTMTQEGLAVFFEVYGHSMSQTRFLTLCQRTHAVKMVEDGADFLQVYRWYLEISENEKDAFYQTQRIFRGAPVTGRYPFTKDVVYLSGLLGVYNFLRLAVKNQNRILVESLVCGRMALEDVGTVAWLRKHGLVNPPKYVPEWLDNWEALLSFFSLSAVLESIDLSSFSGYFDDYYTLENWDLGF